MGEEDKVKEGMGEEDKMEEGMEEEDMVEEGMGDEDKVGEGKVVAEGNVVVVEGGNVVVPRGSEDVEVDSLPATCRPVNRSILRKNTDFSSMPPRPRK